MRWKILVTAPYLQPAMACFQDILHENDIEVVLPSVTERLSEEELLQWVRDVDGVICGDDQFSERVLDAAPRLKVLSKWGTDIDSIDQKACRKRNITIRNTPNAFSEPVADSVLGYILSFARNLPWMNQFIRDGIWNKIPGKALNECVLGVIGVGNVGKAVIRRAGSFGMRILGNDIVEMEQDFISEISLEMVSKDELLREADFVSLNCDLNPTSYHLISTEEFAVMKPTAVIINTARGPIIDERALVSALAKQEIRGAALDVFENEPLPLDSPLRTMENVMLAPHNANSSPRAWERVHRSTINHLLEELKACPK